MPYPNPADVPALQQNADLTVYRAGRPQHRLPRLEHHAAALRQAEVRRALNMAINKDAIIQAVYQGAGQKAVSPIPRPCGATMLR